MTDFILGVFEITIGMSLFIALLLIGLKLFGCKFTAKCRYIIWALVMIRLAIPFSFGLLPTLIEIPIDTELVQSQDLSSVLSENTDPVTSVHPSDPGNIAVNPTVPSTPVFPNVDTANPGSTPILPVTPTVPGDQAESVIPSDSVIETPTEQPVSLRQILDIAGIVYLIGAAGFLTWSLVSYFLYTRKILRSTKAANERTQKIFSTICKKYGIKKQPTLLVASGIHSPAAFGIFQRKIVLPDITFNENGLVGTLAHEVTHCKRGDLYMKLVELIACSLNWFNPLVHIAAFQCEMEMELSCDEKVLSGSRDAARAAYGEVMLDIIRRCRRNRGALTTHFNPKKRAVTARFKNILYGSGKRRGRILIGVCLVLCVLTGAFVACQTGDDLPDDAVEDSKVGIITENLSDFLTEEQIALYETAGMIYPLFNGHSDSINILHLLLEGASFEEQANYRVAYQNENDEIHMIDKTTYRPSYGEYDTFDEFKELCVSVFTEEYFEELNAPEPYSSFIDHNGKLYNIDAAKGGRFGYAPDEFPDEYELVEMSDEAIVFSVTGHYKSSNVDPDFTLTEETFTIKMVLTENGWRFAKFADAMLDEEVYSGDSEDVFYSILENKQSFYDVSWKESMLLSEYKAKTDYSVKKYTILDLNDDRDPEMVLWLGYGTNDYVGFLVLHRYGNAVYSHEFPYRGFNGLKADGVYTSSSSAFNMSICKLDFDGDICMETVLARREGDGTLASITYHIADRSVTKAEFDAYEAAQSEKPDAVWVEVESFGTPTITDIADWDKLPWSESWERWGSKPASNAYNFIYNLVSGESEIPEYNGLGIKEYSISLIEDEGSGIGTTLSFTFKVAGLSLPSTLIPAVYTWTIHDGMSLLVYTEGLPTNYEEGTAYENRMRGLHRFEGNSAVEAVDTYLSWMPYIYEVSPYGEWDPENYHLPYNYICAHYGKNLEISFSELQNLMAEKFGIAVERPEKSGLLSRCEYDKERDTVRYADTRGYEAVHRFLDVREEDGITYVSVMLFADKHYLIPSHTIQYKIGEGDVFLGCEIIREGNYEPRELS